MGESRPVIRYTQDSRCYVNIPTTLLCSTQPLYCAAPVPCMNHRATSGCWKGLCWFGTLYVCGVCRFGPNDKRLRWPLSSPWLPQVSDYRGCTMHFGSPLRVGLKKCCGDKPFNNLWVGVWGRISFLPGIYKYGD